MSGHTEICTMPGTTSRTGLPWRPYVYRGTGDDTLTPPELQAELDAEPDIDCPAPWPCGTNKGYRRHLDAGTQVCPACRAAAADYERKRRAGMPSPPRRTAEHGTPAAYRRHYRDHEKPCAKCRQAESLRNAERTGQRNRAGEYAVRRERYATARQAGLDAAAAKAVARNASRYEQLMAGAL